MDHSQPARKVKDTDIRNMVFRLEQSVAFMNNSF